MSNNLISEIQPGAFANMTRLVRLILSKNKLTKLESGSLSGTPLRLTQGMINFHRMFNISGVSSLVELELSNNFLESIPIAALSSLKNLKFLNLGSNKIKVKSLIHSMAILYVSIWKIVDNVNSLFLPWDMLDPIITSKIIQTSDFEQPGPCN